MMKKLKLRNFEEFDDAEVLTRAQLKSVLGGDGTMCVSCVDTPGYWNQHGNVMCIPVRPGFTCISENGSATNGIKCGNSSTLEYTTTHCPVG